MILNPTRVRIKKSVNDEHEDVVSRSSRLERSWCLESSHTTSVSAQTDRGVQSQSARVADLDTRNDDSKPCTSIPKKPKGLGSLAPANKDGLFGTPYGLYTAWAPRGRRVF